MVILIPLKISPIFIKRSDSEASLENMTNIMVFKINCQARKKLKATVADNSSYEFFAAMRTKAHFRYILLLASSYVSLCFLRSYQYLLKYTCICIWPVDSEAGAWSVCHWNETSSYSSSQGRDPVKEFKKMKGYLFWDLTSDKIASSDLYQVHASQPIKNVFISSIVVA